jgi:hypothetical protein
VTDPVRERRHQGSSPQAPRWRSGHRDFPIGTMVMLPRMASLVNCKERKALDAQQWSHPRSNQ